MIKLFCHLPNSMAVLNPMCRCLGLSIPPSIPCLPRCTFRTSGAVLRLADIRRPRSDDFVPDSLELVKAKTADTPVEGCIPCNLGCHFAQVTTRAGGESFFGLPACVLLFSCHFCKTTYIFLERRLSNNSGNTLYSGKYLGFP